MIGSSRHAFRAAMRLFRTFAAQPRPATLQLKNLPTHLQGLDQARLTPLAADGVPAAPIPGPLENPLREYFDARQEGPGIWKWDHYFEVYHRHLAKFVGRPAHLAEVGIYSGGSLQMWRSYFGPPMHIHGVDIEPVCEVYRAEGIDIHIGDQADRAFWAKFRRDVPQLDIVIDDGGHLPEQQRVTLEEILPHLRPGGVYICEDIHGRHNRFGSYIAGCIDAMNDAVEDGQPGLVVNEFQRWCHSVHVYPFLVVIEKRDAGQSRLLNSRRGTQWQPFFPETA